PPYCGGHWMKELVELAGGKDALAARDRPSYRVAWQDVLDFAPEIIVLTCCGFDVERAARESRILAAFPGANALLAFRNDHVDAAPGRLGRDPDHDVVGEAEPSGGLARLDAAGRRIGRHDSPARHRFRGIERAPERLFGRHAGFDRRQVRIEAAFCWLAISG